jgi:hypothetical protein
LTAASLASGAFAESYGSDAGQRSQLGDIRQSTRGLNA